MDQAVPYVIDMEDLKLTVTHKDATSVTYELHDSLSGREETVTCSKEAFNLALQASEDDIPLSEEDYALAETAMGKIRWIP